jgi:ribosomal protein S18 acetylase RimI-like enzyme
MPALEPISATNAMIFKSVRLRALQDSPGAFGGTFAQEVAFTDADWVSRAAKWSGECGVGYLASEQGRYCGIAGAYLDGRDPSTVHLISMWVAPEARRSGIGSALIAAIEKWAKVRGGRTLRLLASGNNATAIEFYQRVGFAMTGRSEPYPNDPAVIEHEMAKSIAAQNESAG